jgi:hypothetical protein
VDEPDGNGATTPEKKKSGALGAQTITSWGSFILNINNLVGPALVTFPLVYQSGTWLFVEFVVGPWKDPLPFIHNGPLIFEWCIFDVLSIQITKCIMFASQSCN